ncbi:methyltransferase domain-containing protein [Aurantimonas coralicida]|uniref:methyltransferase domain-containing protein n=1 Tax=Aurantimonas coralicida TaxID=182270 RepID=UPI001D190634|nr:class I SAM-dependent methyltransferase [Aurantimonas coralicida]MCC4297775.1 class I SAM-dependent methyltransferase [Aurantimonas coralicida]
MSGFDTNWLDLREPADGAARDTGLLQGAVAWLEGAGDAPLTVDLGCGTGSTLRAVSPHAPRLRWRLVDNDAALLSEAGRRLAATQNVETVQADLTDLDALDLSDVRLVTASALFDLASRDFVERLADRLVAAGAGLYAALSYDGSVAWSEEHRLDAAVVAAFNRHQRGDKGLGTALGPDAGPALADAFAARGYAVRTAPSPWRLGADEASLRRLFDVGMANAVAETGAIATPDLAGWRQMRMENAGRGTCRVGHLDVLALPR